MGIVNLKKDDHEEFLAPEKQWTNFIHNASATSVRYETPSGNSYRFFKGKALLIKDRRDIEHFKKTSHIFQIVRADEEVVLEETGEDKGPIPAKSVTAKIKKKVKKNSKKSLEDN